MPDVAFQFYLIAVGFAVAGLMQSGVQLITGRPLRFALERADGPFFVAGLLARVVAGPIILMRNGLALARQGANKPYWLALTTAIAGLWSLLSGTLVVALLA